MTAITNTSTPVAYARSASRVGRTTFLSSATTCRRNRRTRDTRPVRCCRPVLADVVVTLSPGRSSGDSPAHEVRAGDHRRFDGGGSQGRRDSTPHPPVLETGALPVALLP